MSYAYAERGRVNDYHTTENYADPPPRQSKIPGKSDNSRVSSRYGGHRPPANDSLHGAVPPPQPPRQMRAPVCAPDAPMTSDQAFDDAFTAKEAAVSRMSDRHGSELAKDGQSYRIQSGHPELDGRDATEVAEHQLKRVAFYLNLSQRWLWNARVARQDEINHREQMGLMEDLIDLFNGVDQPDPARWNATIEVFEECLALFEEAHALGPDPMALTRLGQLSAQAIERFTMVVETAERDHSEWDRYQLGIADSGEAIQAFSRDTAVSVAIGVAVIVTAPASVPVGVGALVTTVAGAAAVGMVTGAAARAGLSGLSQITDVILGLDSFDWSAVGDGAVEGANQGLIEGPLALIGIGIDKLVVHAAKRLGAQQAKRVGISLWRKALEKIALHMGAGAIAGGAAGAAEGAMEVILRGGRWPEIREAIQRGVVVGGLLGAIFGPGADDGRKPSKKTEAPPAAGRDLDQPELAGDASPPVNQDKLNGHIQGTGEYLKRTTYQSAVVRVPNTSNQYVVHFQPTGRRPTPLKEGATHSGARIQVTVEADSYKQALELATPEIEQRLAQAGMKKQLAPWRREKARIESEWARAGKPNGAGKMQQRKRDGNSSYYGEGSARKAHELALERGKPVEGKPNRKRWNANIAVGHEGQRQVDVHVRKNSQTHSHPSGTSQFSSPDTTARRSDLASEAANHNHDGRSGFRNNLKENGWGLINHRKHGVTRHADALESGYRDIDGLVPGDQVPVAGIGTIEPSGRNAYLPPEVFDDVQSWADDVLKDMQRTLPDEDLFIEQVTIGVGFTAPSAHVDTGGTYLHATNTVRGPSTVLHPEVDGRTFDNGVNNPELGRPATPATGTTVALSGVGRQKVVGDKAMPTVHTGPARKELETPDGQRVTLYLSIGNKNVQVSSFADPQPRDPTSLKSHYSEAEGLDGWRKQAEANEAKAKAEARANMSYEDRHYTERLEADPNDMEAKRHFLRFKHQEITNREQFEAYRNFMMELPGPEFTRQLARPAIQVAKELAH
ncbi:MAG: hypothetical protein KJO07_15465 [Deltaproteobacteria bacterium]|nr:hypothetical protein [Deltaproteobacteria bacterium]